MSTVAKSYYEANARARVEALLDAATFAEWIPPQDRLLSPHLAALDLPRSLDDGVVIGSGLLDGQRIFIAAQEGAFMGGAVGEVHGAKIVGLLRRAIEDAPAAVVLLLETGGVRLQEANAGLIAVSEIMRAILAVRGAGIPVIVAIGGQYGCFGGMGIAARCATAIVMSEEARMALSGPEVIETANGVDEFDSRDRALVWRTVGGKHRYLIGECAVMVPDSIKAFRNAIRERMGIADDLSLEALEGEHALLRDRVERFGACSDGRDIWKLLGWEDPDSVPVMDHPAFITLSAGRRATSEKVRYEMEIDR